MPVNSEKKKTTELKNTSENASNVANLNSPGVAASVARRIANDIDDYCVDNYDGGHRNHLGASLIGEECSRKLWYIFRWCLHEKTTGRQQRLFNRGHREEARFIEWLEGIGCKVWFEDRESDPLYYVPECDEYILKSNLVVDSMEWNLAGPVEKTNEKYQLHIARAKAQGIEFPQYRISAVNGHFGGALDGIVILPERYGIAGPVLAEFKTNGTGKGFADLLTKGMTLAKPQHFSQTSTYGNKYKFEWCLYLNICKNDDELHVELVKLDHAHGEKMINKAERIICRDTPPGRLSDNPTFFKCKWCHFSEICHTGAVPEVNCRSCKNAVPVENAQWHCNKHNSIIPKEYLPNACPEYKAITQNV